MFLSPSRVITLIAALCLPAVVVCAQELPQERRMINAPPKASGTTPRTTDGHPDLTGVWNGLGDNLLGVPNQMANNGISVDSENSSHDIFSGVKIGTFARNRNIDWNASAEAG